MASLDLKPLDQETIDQNGYDAHDLWMVKIGDDVYGPFETESLKQYAAQNESVFKKAVATRKDVNDFQPFFGYALFAKREQKRNHHKGPFWILQSGMKIGPFHAQDIDKKIEQGLIVVTDHLSVDDGYSWKKVYEFEGFDSRTHNATELPAAPKDESFHRAKLELLEKIEHLPPQPTKDALVEMAHGVQMLTQGTAQPTEESLEIQAPVEAPSRSSWAMTATAMLVVSLLAGGYFLLSPQDKKSFAEIKPEESKTEAIAAAPEAPAPRRAPRGVMPDRGIRERRQPAAQPRHNYDSPEPSNYGQEGHYQTQMEVHSNEPYQEPDRDPASYGGDNEMAPSEMQPQEHSLVSEDQSLDAAMSGQSQPSELPTVEEASDF